MSYNLIIHVLTCAIAFLGLVVEPKKYQEQPYSYRNLSSHGILLIFLTSTIFFVGILSINEKTKESNELKKGLSTIEIQYEFVKSQFEKIQHLPYDFKMLKEALELELQNSLLAKTTTTKLTKAKEVNNNGKLIEEDSIVNLIKQLRNYDSYAANKLILLGQKAVPSLEKAKKEGVILAPYVLHKINSDYAKSIHDGTALGKEIEKLGSTDRDIRFEGAGNIRTLIPSLNNDQKDKAARALSNLIADEKEDDDKSSARIHAVEGLVELRHNSIQYISKYLVNENERVETNMSFVAFRLSELISTNDQNFLHKLQEARNGAGSYYAKKALENFQK